MGHTCNEVLEGRSERRVGRAVRVEPTDAACAVCVQTRISTAVSAEADEQFAVRLPRERVDDQVVANAFGLERRVAAAAHIEPHDLLDGRVLILFKRAGNDSLAVGLQRDGQHFPAPVKVGGRRERADARIVCGIERAVRIEARDVVARRLGRDAEVARDDDFSVRLQGERAPGSVVDSEIVIGKGLVAAAVRVETHEGGCTHLRASRHRPPQIAAGQNLAVGLHGERVHVEKIQTVKVENVLAVERCVEASVRVEPRDGGSGDLAADLGEVAPDDDLAVGLQRERVDMTVRVEDGRIHRKVGAAPGVERSVETAVRDHVVR